MTKTLLIFLLLSLGFGCSRLTERGVLVEVREKAQAGEVEKVGEVACRNDAYLVTRNVNRNLCLDSLRNEASELKADFIVVEKEMELGSWPRSGLELRGSAYKLISNPK